MKIYDAALEHELQNPDLTRGKLESARRVTVHHEAVPASVRREVMADTITADCPNGLRQEITTPAQAAYDAGARGTDATLTPVYLRPCQAERERLEKLKH